jgi:anthranilate phosphoribosyltransferase
MLKIILTKLLSKIDLTDEEIQSALLELATIDNPAQTAAFITLLTSKPITHQEFSAIHATLRDQMVKVTVRKPVLDIVGTGGDGLNTVNISTTAALLAAACGITVVKHGNRAVSSLCGSADVLAELGIPLELTSVGFSFCYAPHHHPLLVKLQATRRQLGVPTVFNLMGPLLNPAQPDRLIIGVADPKYIPRLTYFLAKSSVCRSIVMHSEGSDEICTLGISRGYFIDGSEIKDFYLDPRDYGFSLCQLDDLRGGLPKENAARLKDVFSGIPSAYADSVILTTAVACFLTRRVDSIEAGMKLANQIIASGTAEQFLETLQNSQQEAA